MKTKSFYELNLNSQIHVWLEEEGKNKLKEYCRKAYGDIYISDKELHNRFYSNLKGSEGELFYCFSIIELIEIFGGKRFKGSWLPFSAVTYLDNELTEKEYKIE